jgi:two-component system NarL family response regulator
MGELQPAAPVRVLLVDDEPMFLEALRALLETDSRVSVVAAADNGIDAIALALSEHADVALVDLALPGTSGFETTRRLIAEAPPIKVVVISGLSDGSEANAARDAGASRFLLKGGLHDEIADAIVATHLAV